MCAATQALLSLPAFVSDLEAVEASPLGLEANSAVAALLQCRRQQQAAAAAAQGSGGSSSAAVAVRPDSIRAVMAARDARWAACLLLLLAPLVFTSPCLHACCSHPQSTHHPVPHPFFHITTADGPQTLRGPPAHTPPAHTLPAHTQAPRSLTDACHTHHS